MPDILLDFPVAGTRAAVFAAIATPEGLEEWWTRGGSGEGAIGAIWRFECGPEFQWEGAEVGELSRRGRSRAKALRRWAAAGPLCRQGALQYFRGVP